MQGPLHLYPPLCKVLLSTAPIESLIVIKTNISLVRFLNKPHNDTYFKFTLRFYLCNRDVCQRVDKLDRCQIYHPPYEGEKSNSFHFPM